MGVTKDLTQPLRRGKRLPGNTEETATFVLTTRLGLHATLVTYDATQHAMELGTNVFPPFNCDNCELWFAQLEAIFRTKNARKESEKFDILAGGLRGQALAAVADLIIAPTEDTPYTDVKRRLLESFAPSFEERLRRLQEATMDGRKPSELLQQLRMIAGKIIPRELVRDTWLRKLPEQARASVRGFLASTEDSKDDAILQRAAKLADAIHADGVENKFVEAASSSGRCKYNAGDNKTRANKTRASKPSVNDNGLCWYHAVMGDSARRCRSPCSWKGSRAGNESESR